MKKIMFLSIALAGVALTSCTSSIPVTSVSEYNSNIQAMKSGLSEHGYYLSGIKNENGNNPYVAATSYSTQTGYGTKMENDYYTITTYNFANSEGDNAEILLKYRARYSSYSDCNYYETVSLIGCNTSKSADYQKICGSYAPVQRNVGNMQKDIDVDVYDEGKSYSLLLLLTLLGSCAPLLFLL